MTLKVSGNTIEGIANISVYGPTTGYNYPESKQKELTVIAFSVEAEREEEMRSISCVSSVGPNVNGRVNVNISLTPGHRGLASPFTFYIAD